MPISRARLYQLHRWLAPIMVLPLLLTVTTGVLYQIADSMGAEDSVGWLLRLHHGNFGKLNLSLVYTVLNGLGLFTLLATGITMWLRLPKAQRFPGSSHRSQ